MKKLVASTLCFALAMIGFQPMTITVTAAAQGNSAISGTATDANKAAMSNVKVQLRNVDTGQLAGTTTSGANGAYSFNGLPAGNYVVEIVNAAGQVIGTSAAIAVAAGAVITGVTISASAAGAAAAGAAAAGGAAFFTTTTGLLVTAAAVVGGVSAVVAATNDASPSQ